MQKKQQKKNGRGGLKKKLMLQMDLELHFWLVNVLDCNDKVRSKNANLDSIH